MTALSGCQGICVHGDKIAPNCCRIAILESYCCNEYLSFTLLNNNFSRDHSLAGVGGGRWLAKTAGKILRQKCFVTTTKVFLYTSEVHCVSEKPISSDKKISRFQNQIQRQQVPGKLCTKSADSIPSPIYVENWVYTVLKREKCEILIKCRLLWPVQDFSNRTHGGSDSKDFIHFSKKQIKRRKINK